ncbi:MAG: glycosyltransferase family 39 protein [Acidobacteriia bacterium]|nr:glycosyltransferase family 39 protein [Terriglobia bacterium]
MKTLVELVRRNWLFFLLATIAALALRLFFVFRFPHVAGDSLIYGDIAKNLLDHGIFGITDNGLPRSTLIRLPGYPGFLAAMFTLFGHEHYTAVMIAQALIDTNTCLVIAGLALELMNARAAKAAYLLAALCPFTACYVAAPLSETLSICCIAHTLYYGVRGLKALQQAASGRHFWILAGLWSSAAIFMRPDNGLVLPPLGLALLVLLLRRPNKRQVVFAGILLAATSLGPLVPWTARNWRVFHVWQPLASRYANDPGEFVPHGFNHWVKTWLADYVSVEEVFWHVSGEPIDPLILPERAFDTRPEYEKTQALIARYNQELYITPEMDAEFEEIARLREEHNPLRYTIWLPFLRTTDMWLRPRTELLNIETRWWEFNQHEGETAFAVGWAGLCMLYIAAALRGWMHWRLGLAGVLLIGFVLLRSLFLSTLENPEPRYVLECFPVLLALAGGAFARSVDAVRPVSKLPSE